MKLSKEFLKELVKQELKESYYDSDYAEEEAASTPPDDREAYELGKEDAKLGLPEEEAEEKAEAWKRERQYAKYNDYLKGYDDAVQYHQFGTKKKQDMGEGRLVGRGNAKDITAGMKDLASTLQKFDISSLDDPRFADSADCLQQAWATLQTAADTALTGNLENDGECPAPHRLEECGEMVTDEPMPMPGPPPEGACGMEPAFDDHEGHMAKSQLFNLVKDSNELVNMLGDQDQLPSWVQAKITKAVDYLGAVKQYLEYERVAPRQPEPVHENKISRRRLVAIVKKAMSAD